MISSFPPVETEFFGGKKIPELMRGLGSGIKEFKDASKEDTKDLKEKE